MNHAADIAVLRQRHQQAVDNHNRAVADVETFKAQMNQLEGAINYAQECVQRAATEAAIPPDAPKTDLPIPIVGRKKK